MQAPAVARVHIGDVVSVVQGRALVGDVAAEYVSMGEGEKLQPAPRLRGWVVPTLAAACPALPLPRKRDAISQCPLSHVMERGVTPEQSFSSIAVLPRFSKRVAVSKCPSRHEVKRGARPLRSFSSIAVLDRCLRATPHRPCGLEAVDALPLGLAHPSRSTLLKEGQDRALPCCAAVVCVAAPRH